MHELDFDLIYSIDSSKERLGVLMQVGCIVFNQTLFDESSQLQVFDCFDDKSVVSIEEEEAF